MHAAKLHACPNCRRITFAVDASPSSPCEKCSGRSEADSFLDDVPTVPRIVVPLSALQ